jgi:hypothetical protein
MGKNYTRYGKVVWCLLVLAMATISPAHNIAEEIKDPLVNDVTSLFMMGLAVLGAFFLMHQIRK